MPATSLLASKAAKATIAATMAFALTIPMIPASSYAADDADAVQFDTQSHITFIDTPADPNANLHLIDDAYEMTQHHIWELVAKGQISNFRMTPAENAQDAAYRFAGDESAKALEQLAVDQDKYTPVQLARKSAEIQAGWEESVAKFMDKITELERVANGQQVTSFVLDGDIEGEVELTFCLNEMHQMRTVALVQLMPDGSIDYSYVKLGADSILKKTVTSLGAFAILDVQMPEKTKSMHRLYNPNSGEHFYTSRDGERDHLMNLGWRSEGEGWAAPETGDPVYRLYNRNGGEHHYTKNAGERDMLVNAGWEDEGIGWYSDPAQGVPVYREYNPNERSNNHNYTRNQGEHNWLTSLGWRDEGIAWYGI